MFTIHSADFSHSADETYAILDSYLTFAENSRLELAKSGIVVSTKPNDYGGVYWVKVQLDASYKFMHEAIMAELKEHEAIFDDMCNANQIQTAQEHIEKYIASAGESASEGGCHVELERLRVLYKRVWSDEITLSELEQIIVDEHYQ